MATLNKFQSDVVLGGVQSSDLGYSVEEVTVTIAAGMSMGSVLEATSVAGKYTWVATATVADANAILIDTRAEGYEETLPDGDHILVVAKRGTTANKTLLNFSGTVTAPNQEIAFAAFEVAGANKVTDKFVV